MQIFWTTNAIFNQLYLDWCWNFVLEELCNWVLPMTNNTTNHEHQHLSSKIILSFRKTCSIINPSNIIFVLGSQNVLLCIDIESIINTVSYLTCMAWPEPYPQSNWSHHRKKQAYSQLMLPNFWYLLDVATKDACKQSHLLFRNNNARSLQIALLPNYSNWNVCLWILHCILDFQTAVWKHH